MTQTHSAAKVRVDGQGCAFSVGSEQGRTDTCTTGHARSRLTQALRQVRSTTEILAARLSPEDQCLQSMPDCSPTKWHRAHTTWFFEEFLLMNAGFTRYRDEYAYLFNSYYESAGARHPRPQRGLLSRPSANELGDYRRAIDERLFSWLEQLPSDTWLRVKPLLELGIAHEQQHQELLLTDILHAFAQNPLRPVYLADGQTPASHSGISATSDEDRRSAQSTALQFLPHSGGLTQLGIDPTESFCFDNESPRHQVYVEPFELATRPIVVAELKAFIEAGGYDIASLWLSEGLDWVRRTGAQAPLHASYRDGQLRLFTLRGEICAPDAMIAPHLNYYEADAIARFLGARLPTEAEWELAACVSASTHPLAGNWLESGRYTPTNAKLAHESAPGWGHLFGDVWEWTSSAYSPYPGYSPAAGAVGEYNGKFMVNQLVLRGGSCLTPAGHVRPTYRNFWPAATSFQMTGARVARSM